MEELENKRKESTDYLNEINEEISLDDFKNELNDMRPSETFQDKFSKFDVFFNFTIQKKEFVFQIKSDLFNLNRQYSYELIKNIVKKINEKNITINQNNTNYIVSLKDFDDSEEENNMDFYSRNYELKPINKINFTSIKESENYSSDSLLKNIDNKKISFVAKNSFNIMLREKNDTNIEEGDNKYSSYYDDDED
jgi:hypothetical protein